ncbi:nucleotide disphospho-sugar-binding domain-containing protein [Streptomyces sp. NPDC050997]|uniref:nucleotide disphospho-sugar-binding domain-containing protein n=1 Tax=Streptomyces sp. NPDC050997 TaxID=3155519 RepID=UPI003427C586
MRILICTYSTASDIFATIPLAWALRSAGHEILYAGGGDGMRECAKAGFPFVDLGQEVDLTEPFRRRAEQTGSSGQLVWYRGGVMEEADVNSAVELFGELSDLIAPGAVSLARGWRPEVVVSTDIQGSGPLIASLLSVPLVPISHLFALVPDMVERLRSTMAATYDAYDISGSPRLVQPVRTTPLSMNAQRSDHLLMRHIPYNGSYLDVGSLPDWLLREPRRRRVLVTLGTFVPKYGGLAVLPDLMAQLSAVDAEFVFALGDVDQEQIPPAPSNVRFEGWLPLNAVLGSCSAVVHHGGSGTTLAALSAGVPQIILAHGADQHFNAHAVATRGLGVAADKTQLTAELIAETLASSELAKTAAEVRDEISAMPAPREIAAKLEDIVK